MAAWDAHKQRLFDGYIYDYMRRRNLDEAAETFRQEAEIGNPAVGLDAGPDGFLKEWWNVFWDVHSHVNPRNITADEITVPAHEMPETPIELLPEMPGGEADFTVNVEQFGHEFLPLMSGSRESSTEAQKHPEVFEPADVSEKIERDKIYIEVKPQPQLKPNLNPKSSKDGGQGVEGETSKAVPIPGDGKSKQLGNEEVTCPGLGIL